MSKINEIPWMHELKLKNIRALTRSDHQMILAELESV